MQKESLLHRGRERIFITQRERERDLSLLVQDSYNEFEDKQWIEEEKMKLNTKKY